MSAQETKEIRELTPDELTAVSGGRSSTTPSETTHTTDAIIKALNTLAQSA